MRSTLTAFGLSLLMVALCGCELFESTDHIRLADVSRPPADAGTDSAGDMNDASSPGDMTTDADAVSSDAADLADVTDAGPDIDASMDMGIILDEPAYFVATDGDDAAAGTREAPWKTLAHAVDQLAPGDTLYLRGGSYSEELIVPRSGLPDAPIAIRGFPGETAVIEDVPVAIRVENKSQLVFSDLHIRKPLESLIRVVSSSEITLERLDIDGGESTDGREHHGVGIWGSDFVRIMDSEMRNWFADLDASTDPGGVVLSISNGSHNLVENNVLENSGGYVIYVDSKQSVARSNTIRNDTAGCLTLQALDGPRDYIVIEDNVIGPCVEADNFYSLGTGIASWSDNAIIRRNVIHSTESVGVFLAWWDDFTMSGNRFFHNTVYRNNLKPWTYESSGVYVGTTGSTTAVIEDTRLINNIIGGNSPTPADRPIQLGIEIPGPMSSPPFGGTIVAGNLIDNQRPTICSNQALPADEGDCPIEVIGVGDADVAWFEANHGSNVFGNAEGSPEFADAAPIASGDFSLDASSGAVDLGNPLTRTTSAGSGTTVPVEDTGFFHDGFGGLVEADEIVVGGETVQIESIDRDTSEITVDRMITWSDSAPVTLPFVGLRPDSGAVESH